ncbi:uncharacterized protein LOC114362127 [Ostrinia furnacalis]|uniref:uncharacterized protein LOC114362127 n=1 Tax=Ostrinia furnacalis TaxID=93504 RepID=UPI00103E08AA|nr:uncharacterized protein LOC114362127 [Ostrinia furnacalis]
MDYFIRKLFRVLIIIHNTRAPDCPRRIASYLSYRANFFHYCHHCTTIVNKKMNLVCLFGILFIAAETSGFAEASQRKGELRQRILLRKLQSFQRNDATNPESVTWNEILADALVTKLNVFSRDKNIDVAPPKKNVATVCLSEILTFFKSVYDNFKQKPSDHNAVVTQIESKPKEEVEVIHPTFKMKRCEDCTDGDGVVSSMVPVLECPTGFVLDKDGKCITAPSKLIMAIPNQCPNGYRRDRLGYCRLAF